MSNLQQQINRAKTLQESYDSLTESYESLAGGLGGMVMMTDAEMQPALNDLLSQLD